MAKLVFGMNQSLDGYVDHQEFAPGPSLFRHFTEQVRDLAGSVYGRRMYEVMRYWDEDQLDASSDRIYLFRRECPPPLTRTAEVTLSLARRLAAARGSAALPSLRPL